MYFSFSEEVSTRIELKSHIFLVYESTTFLNNTGKWTLFESESLSDSPNRIDSPTSHFVKYRKLINKKSLKIWN